MRYALAQLRDGQLAEEAVQEALLAALEGLGTFGGKSTLRDLAYIDPALQGDRPAAPGGERAQPRGAHLLSAAYERKLSPAESQALTYHLDRCLMCRNFDSQLRFLHAAAERFRSGNG